MTHLLNRFKALFYFSYIVTVLATVCVSTPALADLVLNQGDVDRGAVELHVAAFHDDTGARSPVQAAVQFNRLKNAGQITSGPLVRLGGEGGDHWVVLTVTNNTRQEKWSLSFTPARENHPNPIRSMALYDLDAHDLKPLAVWPELKDIHLIPNITMLIRPGETVTRYVLLDSWPDIQVPLKAELKTIAYLDRETIDQTRKINLLWLIMGAVFGAGLVQLILTRQGVQGMLALNALVVGGGLFLLNRYDLVPALMNMHALVLPLALASLFGIAASLMLWTASHRLGIRSLIVIVPILINAAFFFGALLQVDTFFNQFVSAESIPFYLLTLTGLFLLGVTIVFTLTNAYMAWFLPAWFILTLMPWVSSYMPMTAVVLYLLALAVAGVASVFSYWKSMDRETASLQFRLRSELKNIKSKYEEENDNWNKKMESQRGLLNELRQREQQRSSELELAKKDAETANKAKSDFLAIISHEIRTPMNGIMGIVQIIEQTPLNDKQREYIDVIKNSGDTMVTLLNDILDYSKIEKGVIDLENIPFSLRKLVNSVATLMSGRAKDKGVTIHVDIAEDIGDTYMGDPGRIRQVLLNLVSNAVKFTDKGSVDIRVAAQGRNILFEIIDTGIGIPTEAQAKLFKAYTQADSSISRRYGGTGLGLNICRMLVEAMSGRLGVNSSEGKGSTFWFDIPLDATSEKFVEARREIAGEYKPRKKLYALVVDDNPVNLKIITSFLEMDGHEVVAASDGAKALDLINQDRFDVAFVDMLMPVMDGKTFIKKLRQNPLPVRANMPVFALTGLSDETSRAEIMASGMNGVIVKPVSQTEIRHAIDSISNQPDVKVDIHDISVGDIMSKLDTLSDSEKESLRKALSQNAPAAPSAAPVVFEDYLDMTILSELKSGLPPETLQEIFAELIEKAKDLTHEVEQAFAAQDMHALNEKAHNIKGMAGNFGLKALMQLHGGIEKAAREGDHEKVAALVRDSRHILDQSLTALDQWMNA